MNDFSQLDAQNEISNLAQVTYEEIYMPTQAGVELNAQSWDILRDIHKEIDPILEQQREREQELFE